VTWSCDVAKPGSAYKYTEPNHSIKGAGADANQVPRHGPDPSSGPETLDNTDQLTA
jgi:hypothetical protein